MCYVCSILWRIGERSCGNRSNVSPRAREYLHSGCHAMPWGCASDTESIRESFSGTSFQPWMLINTNTSTYATGLEKPRDSVTDPNRPVLQKCSFGAKDNYIKPSITRSRRSRRRYHVGVREGISFKSSFFIYARQCYRILLSLFWRLRSEHRRIFSLFHRPSQTLSV